jgi:hypothetical protein
MKALCLLFILHLAPKQTVPVQPAPEADLERNNSLRGSLKMAVSTVQHEAPGIKSAGGPALPAGVIAKAFSYTKVLRSSACKTGYIINVDTC